MPCNVLRCLCLLALPWLVGVAQAAPVRYAINPAHTVTTYELGSVQSGRFERHSGSIVLDLAEKTGHADVTIDTASIHSGVALFDQILLSTELFDAAHYPTLLFVGDRFAFNGETLTEVGGNLTLLGITQPVLLAVKNFECHTPADAVSGPEVCAGSFETTIDRTLFGMDLGVSLGLPKSVHLLIQVEALQQ